MIGSIALLMQAAAAPAPVSPGPPPHVYFCQMHTSDPRAPGPARNLLLDFPIVPKSSFRQIQVIDMHGLLKGRSLSNHSSGTGKDGMGTTSLFFGDEKLWNLLMLFETSEAQWFKAGLTKDNSGEPAYVGDCRLLGSPEGKMAMDGARKLLRQEKAK